MRSLGDTENFAVTISPAGRVLAVEAGEILISRTAGNSVEGGLARFYLREFIGEEIRLHALLGPGSVLSEFVPAATSAEWSGAVNDLSIRLSLQVDAVSRALVWEVDVENAGSEGRRFDLVWFQDVGVASRGALESNEAYAAHYLDESVFMDEGFGPVLMYRQNLPQVGGRHPWLVAACLTGAESYATDAFDVFGNGYRCGSEPEGLLRLALSNRRYQYEFSCAALASAMQDLSGGAKARVTFGLRYKEDHPEASGAEDLAMLDVLNDVARTGSDDSQNEDAVVAVAPAVTARERLHGIRLSHAELQDLYPSKWRHVEESGDEVMSFFTGEERHIVTAAKEALVERPHGSILVGKADGECLRDVLATTVYMAGIFSAQTVIGNSAFHCANTLPREPLGLSSVAGLRIYKKGASGWCALGVPSVFEMERDECRWLYKMEEGTLRVSVALDAQRESIRIHLEADGSPCRYLLANELTAQVSEAELESLASYGDGEQSVIYRFEAPGRPDSIDFVYGVSWPAETAVAAVGGSELLGSDGLDTLSVLVTETTSSFDFCFSASVDGPEILRGRLVKGFESRSPELGYWESFNRDLAFGGDSSLERLEDALCWYSHNALIHYASPHGLEQYSGAAWGTRDACQGPFEYFIAQQHHGLARRILLRTFSSQYIDTGDWPQWFMHDEYAHVAQHHAHGDIVVWPLKALALYLQSTGDEGILDEPLPYLNPDNSGAEEVEALSAHVERALKRVEDEFIPGTHLIRYGGGDWDDSLQPVNHDLAARLVSGWTVGLLAQALSELESSLSKPELKARVGAMAASVRDDFRKHVVIDGQVAGFLLFDENFEAAEPLLHPKDQRTGMANRLIPMTRSIIAGLVTREEADHQMERIASHLKFPDGVRLMDRPAPYQGGLETFFRRAESAANFGREIGLQYVHAHIRYAEALAKLGNAEGLYEALLTICPVAIADSVPNAAMRQANMYFSSSDGDFLNRADAAENFDKLRDGSVEVKGGWRLYSSGPGLYTGIVIRQLFGLRELADSWVFDPVLPSALDGTVLDWTIGETKVRIEYRSSGSAFGPQTISCGGSDLSADREENPYRTGGLVVEKAALYAAIAKDPHLVVSL